jgi:carbon storage regulator CsrA
MLVINRKRGESIVINGDITLTVAEVRGDKVRLAVVCPTHVPVHRQEVYEAIHGYLPSPPPAPRSPEERAFLDAVLQTPDDEGIRLIFADWLEEHDDPFGEFIRTQCALAALPGDDERRPALEQREQVLWAEHAGTWRKYLPLVLRSAPFERGFVETVHLSIGEFLGNAEGIFATAPVRRLRCVRPASPFLPNNEVASLAASPYLARLAEIDLSSQALTDAVATLLANSPHAAGLRSLVLRNNQIGDAGAAALAGSPHLGGLSVLDLGANRVGPAGAEALAGSPHLVRLHRLRLSGNPLGKTGAAALRTRFGEVLQL